MVRLSRAAARAQPSESRTALGAAHAGRAHGDPLERPNHFCQRAPVGSRCCARSARDNFASPAPRRLRRLRIAAQSIETDLVGGAVQETETRRPKLARLLRRRRPYAPLELDCAGQLLEWLGRATLISPHCCCRPPVCQFAAFGAREHDIGRLVGSDRRRRRQAQGGGRLAQCLTFSGRSSSEGCVPPPARCGWHAAPLPHSSSRLQQSSAGAKSSGSFCGNVGGLATPLSRSAPSPFLAHMMQRPKSTSSPLSSPNARSNWL